MADRIIKDLAGTDQATFQVAGNAALTTADVVQTIGNPGSADAIPSEAAVRAALGGAGVVSSVNGQTGVVVLTAADVGADPSGSAAAVQAVVDDIVDIGAQIIVNGTTGNDATGLRGRLDRPFLTIAAAYAASVSGDEIKAYGSITETVSIVNGTKNVRITMEPGSLLTINGITLFDGHTTGPRILGGGAITAIGSGRLIRSSANIFVMIDVVSLSCGVNAQNEYLIELTGGGAILGLFVRSTASQSTGAVGGLVKFTGSAMDVQINQSTDNASRNTPLYYLTGRGSVELGNTQNTANTNGASTAPMYYLGVQGSTEVSGGTCQGAGTVVQLQGTSGIESCFRMKGVAQQGSGILVDHKDGKWCADLGISGGLSTTVIALADGAAGSGIGISGFIAAASGQSAVKINNTTDSVEITAKLSGDVSIANGATIQMRGAEVIGTVKSTSGTGTVKGATPWAATVFPTAAVAGVVPTINAGLV